MRRAILCFCLALVASLFVATPAAAGRAWCARDPIVNLGGHIVQVWVAIPNEYVDLVNGPIGVEFTIPAGMDRAVLFTDDGFNGHGEVVSFVDDGSHAGETPGSFFLGVRMSVPLAEGPAGIAPPTRGIPMRITVIDDGQTSVLQTWSTSSRFVTPVTTHHVPVGIEERE